MTTYTFRMPFRGAKLVKVDAESLAEATERVNEGDWDDQEEISYESQPELAEYVEIDNIW